MYRANIIYCVAFTSFFEGPAGSDSVVAAALSIRFGCCVDVAVALVSAGGAEVETATVGPAIMGSGDAWA